MARLTLQSVAPGMQITNIRTHEKGTVAFVVRNVQDPTDVVVHVKLENGKRVRIYAEEGATRWEPVRQSRLHLRSLFGRASRAGK